MGYQKPIQINPDAAVRKKIEDVAKAENRAVGPTALELIKRYFELLKVKAAS